MDHRKSFNEELVSIFEQFQREQDSRYTADETLVMDLHCHDHNSNVPDELMGRILGVPETWLKTEDLLDTLASHGCNTFTVTNHNNACSCYEMQEKGLDVLTGAEFSCLVPDYRTGIHVLAYGFTPEEEVRLNKIRGDIYKFLEYTRERDIPTIWAHPLYHYKSSGLPSLEFFDKMALIFERFEVINGQRDTWQNMLVKNWLDSLTEERIEDLAVKFGIPADRYCRDPYRKAMAGGSDCHMGIFAGHSGVRLHVPRLAERKNEPRSLLALEALRRGDMAPFGSLNDCEKMAAAFLDYFCQIGINMKDPGLLRMLLHKGEARDKLIAFAVTNGFMELKRHKTTLKFLNVFHDCFSGKAPGTGKSLMVPRVYKNIFKLARGMALTRKKDSEGAFRVFERSIHQIYEELNGVLIDRLEQKMQKLDREHDLSSIRVEEIIEKFEMPSSMRALFGEKSRERGSGKMTSINLSDFMDGLSFPFLSSAVILGAFFTSARVMYKSRPLLNAFAEAHGSLRHPERTLWLTDTLEDSNGVAMVLKSMLQEIRRRDLPIDMLTASNSLVSGDHLIALKPIKEARLSFYEQQPLRIPNILEIHRIFKEGEYSRIVCSTEGPMGLVALYLKLAYSVPAYFYVHTDWMMFADRVLKFDEQNKSRLRRLLRAFYRGYDGLFVLNRDQHKWLIGRDMGFDPSRVFLTAHWADEGFVPKRSDKKRVFGVEGDEPVLLFAGRLSEEKGVMELPHIMKRVRASCPGARIAVAGMGPAEKDLQEAMPDAIYLGWVDHDRLPEVYSAADMLILPSRFDTFGCVVLEALSCGLPVIAYNTKGPKDIILDGLSGYLVRNRNDMAARIVEFLGSERLRASFKKASLKRAQDYDPDRILQRFLSDLGGAA